MYTLNYKRKNNIYNTHYYINAHEIGRGRVQPQLGNGRGRVRPNPKLGVDASRSNPPLSWGEPARLGHGKRPNYLGYKAGPNCLRFDVIIPAQWVRPNSIGSWWRILYILIFIIIRTINIKNSIICGINILIFIIIKSMTHKNSIIGVTNIIIFIKI